MLAALMDAIIRVEIGLKISTARYSMTYPKAIESAEKTYMPNTVLHTMNLVATFTDLACGMKIPA